MKEKSVGINNRIEHKLKGKILNPQKFIFDNMKMAEKIQYHVFYAMGAYMTTPLENLVISYKNNSDTFEEALSLLEDKLKDKNIPTEFIKDMKEDIIYRHCDANLSARLLITTKDLKEVNNIICEGEKQICLIK